MKSYPPLVRRVIAYIRREGLIAPGDPVILAVSGGPDSIALLHIFLEIEAILGIPRVTVIHFNHRLRGEESDADRDFVRDLCLTRNVPFVEGSADVSAVQRSRRVSLEMAARECRHRFFREAVTKAGARKLALGHTADDQAEEILLRISRGTSVSGLAGMPPRTPLGIIRPILFATRAEILSHLDDRRIPFRQDSSNALPFCRRNALRAEGIPTLERLTQPGLNRMLSRLADQVREEEEFWLDLVKEKWKEARIEESAGRWALDPGCLKGMAPALLRRLFRHGWERVRGSAFGLKAAHIDALCALTSRPDTRTVVPLPGGLCARLRNGRIALGPADEPPGIPSTNPENLIQTPGKWMLGEYAMEIQAWEGDRAVESLRAMSSAHTVFMDAGAVRWPLELGRRRPGDRFHPLGVGGARKIHDFFVDSKIPRDRRDDVPILRDSEKIVWVVGMRLDDRVKVTAASREILRLSLHMEERPEAPGNTPSP